MITQVSSGGLTPVEKRLVEYVGRGERLDLAEGVAVDEDAMRSWDERRTCQATVIRNILLGRLVTDPDPHGLRLRGARIRGRLDLENLITDVNLELEDCFLQEGLIARGARLPGLSLAGCVLKHHAEPPLDGVRLTCGVLNLHKATITGRARDGAVCLIGAHIAGQLTIVGARLRNELGPALHAANLQVGQSMYMRSTVMYMRSTVTAFGRGNLGTVRLTGARIGGNLECDGAMLLSSSGPALAADGLQVGGAMFLRGFTAVGRDDFAAVRLISAHVGGQLECSGADLFNDSGSALRADGLQVDQGMFLRGGFTAAGAGQEAAAVGLTGARVGGVLVFDPERLRHKVENDHRLAVDGLTYPGVPETGPAWDWRKLL